MAPASDPNLPLLRPGPAEFGRPRAFFASLVIGSLSLTCMAAGTALLVPLSRLDGLGVPFSGLANPTLIGLGFWVAVTVMAAAAPIRAGRGYWDTCTAPMISAMVLGGPVAAFVVSFLSLAPREWRGRLPWYAQISNRIACSIGAIPAGIAYVAIAGVIGGAAGSAAAALVGGGIFVAFNIAWMVATNAMIEPGATLAAAWHDSESQVQGSYSLVIIGWLMAQIYLAMPWAVLFFAVPLWALRSVYAKINVISSQERLRADKEAAERANDAKSAFLAMMSHEIRTPMNAILGNAGLLAEENLEPGARESVDAIESAGQSLLAIINDVLDFSKIEADRLNLERVGFGPADLVRSVVALYALPAADKGVTLTAEVDSSIPMILAGDPHRLRQILTNLVGNALKFTSAGSVVVRVRPIVRSAGETTLRFEVTDTGIGIDPAGQTGLFTPFVQVDSSTTRRFGGTGLGLAICKRLVELMDGQIGVDSTPGSGSTFWFTVRLPSPSDAEAQTLVSTDEVAIAASSIVGARVLVAEDNAANKRLIERLLRRMGVDVAIVNDGREAIDAATAGTFDLVLMDCHMPEMDGFGATRAIRAAGASLPIVALTADALSGDREACLAAGMNDYLPKPVVARDLATMIARWLPATKTLSPLATRIHDAARLVDPDGAIDLDKIDDLCDLDPDGSEGFLCAMIASYEEISDEAAQRIRLAIDDSDPAALGEAAHKLKGTAGNLGAKLVQEEAARLVVLARTGTVEGASAMSLDLEAAMRAASERLSVLATGATSVATQG